MNVYICVSLYFLLFLHFRTYLMTTSVLVSRATLEETVRWRSMSVCLVLVRMEVHVLTLLMGTTATAQLTLRYVVDAVHFLLLVKKMYKYGILQS